MNKAELRKIVEPYLSLSDKDSDIFLAFESTRAMIKQQITQSTESVIEENFNLIVDHKKDLLETLLLGNNTKNIIKKLLTYPPRITKLFLYITSYLEVPTDIVLKSFSDQRLLNYMVNIDTINYSFFDRLVESFWKEDLKQYLYYVDRDDGILMEYWDSNISTTSIAKKFTKICDVCNPRKNIEWYEKIFTIFEEKLKSTSILTEKVWIFEEHSENAWRKTEATQSLQIDTLDIFTLNKNERQIFKKVYDAVNLIYMKEGIPLYQKESQNLNKEHLINGLNIISETQWEWDMFYNFVIQHSTSHTVQWLINNINSYIPLYQSISEEVNHFNEHDICDYLLNLSIETYSIDTTIKIEDIKTKNKLKDYDIQNPSKIWKILRIYEILQNHYEKNIWDQEAIKKLREQIISYKNTILTNEYPEILDSFFNAINNYSHDDLFSWFIQTNALLDNVQEKFKFYEILNGFKGKHTTLINIFNTCIKDKNIEILKNIHNKATTKDKNQIRQYLYSEYLSDTSIENKLFFEYIRNFITDDLTHTITLYTVLPVLQKYIEKNPEELSIIVQLRHQVSKRSIEEQNAFCHTIILLQEKNIIDVFLQLCKNVWNHQKRKQIIWFYKTIDIYYKIWWSDSINIKNELLIWIQEKKFPSIYLEELFWSIAEKINIPIDVLIEITNNEILTKFIWKVLSTDDTIQNKKLGLLISEYIKDWWIWIRSNFYESELLTLFQSWETNNENEEESNSQLFSIAGIDQMIRPNLQYETSYIKHISGITHKEQRQNTHNAFDELFDPDIYQDEYKPFMEKLYRQDRKSTIVDLLKQTHPDNQILPKLEFLLSHIQEIDTILSSVKADENDWQVYDDAIRKAQTLYQKIYKDILQTGNEQRAIRCEEYSGNLWLILHDWDITKEDSLRESMNLETTMTYDIVKTLSHMRWCIGLHWWKTKTNLNYLLPNRFFLYSQNQESEKWVSDQIIIVISSPRVWPMYIMDTLYGTRNLNIIMNHIQTLYNHIESHKKQLNTPIFIPPNVISSAGMNTTTLLWELQKHFPEECIKTITDLEVDTTRAWYKEFSTSWQGILLYQKP